jgi:hypothetical protein
MLATDPAGAVDGERKMRTAFRALALPVQRNGLLTSTVARRLVYKAETAVFRGGVPPL